MPVRCLLVEYPGEHFPAHQSPWAEMVNCMSVEILAVVCLLEVSEGRWHHISLIPRRYLYLVHISMTWLLLVCLLYKLGIFFCKNVKLNVNQNRASILGPFPYAFEHLHLYRWRKIICTYANPQAKMTITKAMNSATPPRTKFKTRWIEAEKKMR